MGNQTLFTTRAVVIKTQDFKENDKLVWFYTKNMGKITAVVRGAKKSKSKFLSLTLPLCYGEYLMYKGKNLYTLQEGRILNSFQGLLDNLDKLTYSSYLFKQEHMLTVLAVINIGIFIYYFWIFFVQKENEKTENLCNNN